MSFEAIDEEPLLNEEPNFSTVSEEPGYKNPSCFTISLIAVGITALVILIVGLTKRNDPVDKGIEIIPHSNDAYVSVPPHTQNPIQHQTSLPTSQPLMSTTIGISPEI